MLKAIKTGVSNLVSLVLATDAAVIEGQIAAARREIAAEWDKPGAGGDDWVSALIAAAVSATGDDGSAAEVLQSVAGVGQGLVEQFIDAESSAEFTERLREWMRDHATRETLADVRAQLAIRRYRASSMLSDLVDPEPKGATWVKFRPLSAEDLRAAEASAGYRDRLGALHSGRAFDAYRAEQRLGASGDPELAFARYHAALNADERQAVANFEAWRERADIATASSAVVSIDGFDIERGASGYPMAAFIAACPEGRAAATEIAGHVRNVSTLGKSAGSSRSSEPGTQEPGAEVLRGTAGSAPSASGAAQAKSAPSLD